MIDFLMNSYRFAKVTNVMSRLIIQVCVLRHLINLLLVVLLFSSCSNSTTDEAAQFFLKGNVQLQKREFKEAIRFYSEAISKKSDFADAYNNRGLAKFRDDDREGALADYTRAIELDPDFSTAYFNRAEVLLETGDAAGSVADLQRIEKQYRDSTFYQTRLGDAYVRLANVSQAQVAYDRALQLNPNNVEALTNRAALFYTQKAYEQAGEDIQRALRLNPKQDAALNNQSLLLARAGNFAEALTFVERALTVQPRQPFYLNNKAYLLLKLNRPAEALPLVNESLQRDSQNAWAHQTLGLYYLSQQQIPPALAAFRQAEKLDASVDQLYYYIGKAEQTLNHQQAACEAWRLGEAAGDEQSRQMHAQACK
ncbi:Tfp pilus assembly protein PilF [Spirosoma fluviale]|uniref:Tfp pilus assembly protein PilF n=1 Tax=Spirosoma fluviale TaxID=1597977 RepID=A0A286FFD0_9BACT|nr:Tfp pilus assembly protein PilF [Spirosoma fluviale]